MLVATAIIALALSALVASLAVSAAGARWAQRITKAGNLAAAQIEMVKDASYDPVGGYPTIAAPTGYTVGLVVTEVASGLQQITVTVAYDGQVLAVVGNYKVDR